MQKKTFDGFQVFSVQRDYTKVDFKEEFWSAVMFVLIVVALIAYAVIFK